MKGLKNCWEHKGCGREPGGDRVHELGVCPAVTGKGFDGINRGKNAGRVCWEVSGTFCEGDIQGTFASKIDTCLKCDFFQKVAKEEGDDFHLRAEECDMIRRTQSS